MSTLHQAAVKHVLPAHRILPRVSPRRSRSALAQHKTGMVPSKTRVAIHDAAVALPRGKTIALDVETTGLDPFHGARIFCWGYLTELGEYGYMRKTPANIAWVKALFDDPTRTIVFHNAKFDLKMFHFEGVEVLEPKAKIYCTLILAKLFNSMLWDYSLRWLSAYFLHRATDDKDEIEFWLKANKRQFFADHSRAPGFDDAPEEIVKRRVLWDVESTLLLFHTLYPKVNENCPELLETETGLQHVVVDMELTGLRVDISRAKELRNEAIANIAKLRVILDKLVCPLVITRTKNKKRRRKGEVFYEEVQEELRFDEFNPASPIQMPAAFEKLGITLLYKTKPKKGKKRQGMTGGGRWSFDEYAMIRYADPKLVPVIRESSEEGWTFDRWFKAVKDTIEQNKLPVKNWLMPLVLKRTELSKMVSTYYDHIINDSVDVTVDKDGRETGTLHVSFNQIEAMTGRFSASLVQQMPRILGPRECVIPRRNRRNWHFDYEQVEVKIFVHFAKDEKMADAFIRGADIHQQVASEIYDVAYDQVTKEKRKRAKGVVFGITYGSGPATMAETMTKKGLPTNKTEATFLCARLHRKFPSIRRVTEAFRRELHRVGYVTNPFGRRYHIQTKFSYTALNYMCQGTSAELMKRGLLKTWRYLRKHGCKAKVLLTVHDELGIEMPPEEEQQLVPQIIQMMEDRENFFVPITVDAEVVDARWSKKEKPEKYLQALTA